MSDSPVDGLIRSVRGQIEIGAGQRAVEMCHEVIRRNDATPRQRADAYVSLGNICNLLDSSLDGGHHGLGFYCAALIHDPTCRDALVSRLEE